MNDVQRYLFLHTPKTAGTSFRLGLVKALGSRRCHFDYGLRSRHTSALVRKYTYESPDRYRLDLELNRANAALLGGHFDYGKYGPLFEAKRVFAFCRDPQEQLMSHYAHFVRHNDYREGLPQFLASSAGRGIQARMFSGFPLELFGFIGVADRYEQSLQVLRETYGLCLKPLFKNKNPDNPHERKYAVPDDARDACRRAVALDMGVYRRANQLLDARLAAQEGRYSYVHGGIQAADHSCVRGFAYLSGCEDPVTVEMTVDDQPVASSPSTDDRPGLRGAGISRHAYVGFHFRGDYLGKANEQIVVKVAGTGQEIGKIKINERIEGASA